MSLLYGEINFPDSRAFFDDYEESESLEQIGFVLISTFHVEEITIVIISL